ncbi:SOS (error prone) mutagenesis protein UmuD (RumA) [Legionella beliardensis]|uniref:SOS (Error prone) mutagenesis protein UmuD (RumA) n=1 Tax=Legionella beliardensis TaxID=91822 RepID=A0A378JR64_9GAMM|nr:translesion error-prone DNA polymerase V autoproteolytic subunit [Legionella beliardensis]STX55667.1 SOS (error prone) mutagenesis protein UmuD (RumA) [Legionella beliardensis]
MVALITIKKNEEAGTKATVIAKFDNIVSAPIQRFALYSSKVAAGFPSPADDYLELSLDLNEYLIKHPAATFIVRAQGDSMRDAGIHNGDLLIVDRSIEATHDKIVIAALNGELTVKRLFRKDGAVRLIPANNTYSPIDITEDVELVIWGVVTHIIHQAT